MSHFSIHNGPFPADIRAPLIRRNVYRAAEMSIEDRFTGEQIGDHLFQLNSNFMNFMDLRLTSAVSYRNIK